MTSDRSDFGVALSRQTKQKSMFLTTSKERLLIGHNPMCHKEAEIDRSISCFSKFQTWDNIAQVKSIRHKTNYSTWEDKKPKYQKPKSNNPY